MITTANIDIKGTAEGVVGILDSLEGYLTTSMNPNRVALADLGMEPMGWTKLAHSPKAFEIWRKQHQIEPGDHLTLHHLAIMHHARAFDLEMSGRPAEADEDWKAALGFWHRLHSCAVFWDDLAAKACAGAPNRKAVEELRADLPKLLLGIHYDIALDEETRTHRPTRARFHLTLAQNSPFDAQCRSAARAAAYARFIEAIPKHIWVQDELREEEVAKGTRVIEDYLLFDPGCQPALEDALRLQRRMQQARNIKWRSLDEQDGERARILEKEKKDYDHWQPYFKQLVEMREQLEDAVRENVAHWYFISGDSLSAYDKEEEAVKCFETAVLVCADEDDRRKYQKRLVQSLALVARDKAGKQDSGARTYCDKVRARNDLSVLACLFLSQAYLVLFNRVSEDDFKLLDFAEELCHRGLEIESDFDDLQAEESKEHLKSFLAILQKSRVGAKIRGLVKQGEKAMEAQRFQEALDHLNQAEKTARSENVLDEHAGIYWLRTQCNLALGQGEGSRHDLASFRRLTAQVEASDGNLLKQIERLEGACAELAAKVDAYGQPAVTARAQASMAFAQDDIEGGLSRVREAAAASTNPQWRVELARLLNATAVRRFEAGREVEKPFDEATQEIMRRVSVEVKGN